MEEKLTKAAIIESLHNKLSLSRADIHRVIDELFEEIKDGLKEDRVIELRGFGTFEVRTRKGREKARNPKTGLSSSSAKETNSLTSSAVSALPRVSPAPS